MSGYDPERKVYAAIQDDLSRCFYEKRCLFSLTGDQKYLYEFLHFAPEVKAVEEKAGNKDAYIFGCGEYGINTMRLFSEKWLGFLDNGYGEKTFEGIPVFRPDEDAIVNGNALIYITPKYYHKEIREQLLKIGYAEERLVNIGTILSDMMDRQYFDLPYVDFAEIDTFCDLGSYDGLTTKTFFSLSKKSTSKALCFEPMEENIEKVKSNLSDYSSRFQLIEKGAWDEETTLLFKEDGWGSRVGEEGTVRVPVTCLDNVITPEDGVCYIKMDIEGAELEALKGAEKTIKNHKSFLAISVYHKPEDIIELPKLIMSFNPDYKLYFRHYTMGVGDTVLYAIP